MKQYKYRLLLIGMGLAILTALACSGAAAQSSRGGSQAMEKKDGTAMEKKDGPMMDKAETSTMEKKDGATMEKKNDAMMEKKDGATMDKKDDSMMDKKLPDLIRAAHFVDSSPKHGDTTALAPEKITINFDFTLHEISSIKVTKDGTMIDTAKMMGPNGLSMSTTLAPSAGNGLYVVSYKACWPDRSCHDGQFAFIVDDMKKMSYNDMTGKSEVQVLMKDLRFQPSHLIVSKGTRVIWKNEESAPHFVNSDPHPSHNVLPKLNSLVINMGGDDYSYTFTEAGEWGFHCSAHYPDGMVGRIIVV